MLRNDNREAVNSIRVLIKTGPDDDWGVESLDVTIAPSKTHKYVPYCDALGRGNVLATIAAEGIAVAPASR